MAFNAILISRRDKDYKYAIPYAYIVILLVIIAVSTLCLGYILTPSVSDIEKTQADYVIVLGSGLKRDDTVTTLGKKRLDKTIEYLSYHPDVKVILTGGNFESHAMASYLDSYGIDTSGILQEEKSLNTIQNFKNTTYLIQDTEKIPIEEILDKNILIITGYSHLHRAEILAKRLGFNNVYGIAAHTAWYDVPSAYAREIASYIKMSLKILFTRQITPLA